MESKVEKVSQTRVFVPLPASIMSAMGWKVGDWLELTIEGGVIKLRKANLVQIQVEIPPEIMEGVYKYRDEEGYYTDDEALTNLIQHAVATYFEKSNDKELREKATELRGKWLIQIHSA